MGTRGGTAAERPAASERLHKLTVLYDFEYETKGKRVRITKDETLLLVGKTNDDWWQVIRPNDLEGSFVPEQSTFYVPTGYVAQVDSLPDTTRFYVDKSKMFQQAAEPAISVQQPSNQQDVSPQPKEEPRKALRSVIRKLSGNLGSQSDGNKAAKPPKSSKITKVLRKNSVEHGEDGKPAQKSSLIPAKHKDSWESSAFGMCFGRDTKNVDATILNPFQEELENTLSNRLSQRRTIIDTNKIAVDNKVTDKPVDQACDDKDKAFEFESIQNKWEKVSAQVLRKTDNSPKQDNFQYVPLSKIKEDAQKRRSASPNIKIEAKASDTNPGSTSPIVKIETKLSDTPSGSASPNFKVETKVSDADSEAKQSPVSDKNYSLVEKNKKKPVQLPEQKSESPSQNEDVAVPAAVETVISEDPPSKKDIDRLLINDKRKMWAIETLMSELMQSSLNSKSVASSDINESGISGPNQLAQELHEMNVSRRYENAEIQVNLIDSKEDDTKENKKPSNDDEKCKVDSEKNQKKAFDFSPRSTLIKAPISPTAKSPKLLDEYNEANILNDNEKIIEAKKGSIIIEYDEPPSYSNISLRIRRDKVPCNLKMPTKDFREELQLTPSLEKLASEIRFLPASASSMEFNIEKSSPDLDCPATTLSQDSLRLYKRRSKSDGALNRGDQPLLRQDSSDSRKNHHPASSHADISKTSRDSHQQHSAERKRFAYRIEPETSYLRLGHSSSGGGSSSSRYRLNRKSRSLGDLDCSELDEPKDNEPEARRRYKPVPKLRSKESLRRMRPIVAMTASSDRLPTTRPVPAKRRIHHQQLQQQQHQREQCDGAGSLDELREIDIEHSTAVGFKSLLCSPDSGSEECLQYKTFPVPRNSFGQHQQKHQQQQQRLKLKESSRSESSVNSCSAMSRSLSDEAILSSASCSSASPSRLLDGSVENLVELPPGWTQTYDSIAKRVCFVNERGDKWFSSNDSEGKIYFFEENSNESSWALPAVGTEGRIRTVSNGDWPQLFDGNMCILKEGTINKTKITTESGKKLRKTWSSSYAVLTELFLLFFKDAKTFAAMKMDQSAGAKPDISVDLNGAFIEPTDKLSNRKNVYVINTLLGLQVLIQSDNALVIAEWYREIHDAIQRLPFSQEYGRFPSSRE